jgi:cytochrome c-type biogenesis protein CcmH/NrfG
MENENGVPARWKSAHAYTLAVICLVLGVIVGYLISGSASGKEAVATATRQVPDKPEGNNNAQPSPEQLRHIAAKSADSLLAQLATKPNDAKLLAKIGDIYSDARQYKDAVEYYSRALRIDARNVDVRTDLATAQFYGGNTDAAIAEFNRALQYEPKHVGALFNLGVVKWQGKNDPAGAVAAWERLLKANPDSLMRQRVQDLIAKAKQHAST